MKIKNMSRNVTLSESAVCCQTLWSRLRGLLGRKKLTANEAFWLRPCDGIHTMGMTYPIDAYFLDKKNCVIAIAKNLKPNRISKIHLKARSVVEMASGAERDCQIGDVLSFSPDPPLKGRLRDKKGQSIVEFAIVAPLTLIAIFAIIDVGITVFSEACLQAAANYTMVQIVPGKTRTIEAVQVVQGATMAEVQNYMVTKLGQLGQTYNASQLALKVSCVGTFVDPDTGNPIASIDPKTGLPIPPLILGELGYTSWDDAAILAKTIPASSYVLLEVSSNRYLSWTQVARSVLHGLGGASISGSAISARAVAKTEQYI